MASINQNEDRSLEGSPAPCFSYRPPRQGEQGFVLVGALLILVILVLVGIAATTSTVLELQIAGADRVNKETFHIADGGTQLAARLIEESLGSPGGFTKLGANLTDPPAQPPLCTSSTSLPALLINDPVAQPNITNSTVLICDRTLAENDGTPDTPTDLDSTTLRPIRDIAFFPGKYVSGSTIIKDTPHTNMTMSGITRLTAGSGLQMVAGYEGKGKGTAGGGGQILYTIFSQHMGRTSSESVVQVVWRHVIGLELETRY